MRTTLDLDDDVLRGVEAAPREEHKPLGNSSPSCWRRVLAAKPRPRSTSAWRTADLRRGRSRGKDAVWAELDRSVSRRSTSTCWSMPLIGPARFMTGLGRWSNGSRPVRAPSTCCGRRARVSADRHASASARRAARAGGPLRPTSSSWLPSRSAAPSANSTTSGPSIGVLRRCVAQGESRPGRHTWSGAHAPARHLDDLSHDRDLRSSAHHGARSVV